MMTMINEDKRFKVVSIHYTTECPMNCPFCYKQKVSKDKEKPREFWLELVPYLKTLTNQIALGSFFFFSASASKNIPILLRVVRNLNNRG